MCKCTYKILLDTKNTVSLEGGRNTKCTITFNTPLGLVLKFLCFAHCCPLQHKRCIPASLEAYYAAQDANSRGRFYTVISHYSMAKQTTSHSVSPWLPGGAGGQPHEAKLPAGEGH